LCSPSSGRKHSIDRHLHHRHIRHPKYIRHPRRRHLSNHNCSSNRPPSRLPRRICRTNRSRMPLRRSRSRRPLNVMCAATSSRPRPHSARIAARNGEMSVQRPGILNLFLSWARTTTLLSARSPAISYPSLSPRALENSTMSACEGMLLTPRWFLLLPTKT
jgi:hypothetical protein